MTTLYGIPNCDTVKKARRWLEEAGVGYRFHDLRKDGVDEAMLGRWIAVFGWEKVLNRAGTTFRNLPEADKAGLDAAKATRLMLAAPAMIKRPVLEMDGPRAIGFRPDLYRDIFAAN